MATTNTEEVIDIKVTVRNKERFLENLGNDASVINFSYAEGRHYGPGYGGW